MPRGTGARHELGAARATTRSEGWTIREVDDPRVIAVDWSGARTGLKRKLWLAQAQRGRVERLESQRTREELVAHLVARVRDDPRLVIGLDFAFAFPEWFARARGCSHAHEVWDLVAREGETWLADCRAPFWGRPGRRKPPQHAERDPYRATEGEIVDVRGVRPKSVFQIGGAGAVGTGSLRGMPFLATLRRAGCSIWPFDDARLPLVVEIYPRYLTGPVMKSSRAARELFVRQHAPQAPASFAERAFASEDAFDAFFSAQRMSREVASFAQLEPARHARERLEGRIWVPASLRVRLPEGLRR